MSTYVSVVISPATTTRPVVTSVSHATRPCGSSASTASSTLSEIWSAILSGWPSVTDSDVNRKSRLMGGNPSLASRLDLEEQAERALVAFGPDAHDERAQGAAVSRRLGWNRVVA